MTELPDLTCLSHGEKAALIRALWAQVQALTARVAELEAKQGEPPKNSDNSSQPPSRDNKPNRADKPKRKGPRKGSLGRKGGGRALSAQPDETVSARPMCCAQCQAAFDAADHQLVNRYDKIELPKVTPVVTRVELYAGHCQACGATTLAPLPEGLEPGSPFSVNIVALALYLRFTHAIGYKRLSRMMLELFGLAISEGALDAAFRRARPRMDAEVGAILARLRRARVVCSDETSVRVAGQTCWNWVFQNGEVVIHVVRHSRGAGVVGEVMDGHRPALWVSDLYSAQQGHAADWQICLAHQLRDCQFAIEAAASCRSTRAERCRTAPPRSSRRTIRKRFPCQRTSLPALRCETPEHAGTGKSPGTRRTDRLSRRLRQSARGAHQSRFAAAAQEASRSGWWPWPRLQAAAATARRRAAPPCAG